MGRRYIAEVTRAAVLEELRSGVSARELARKYSISESSISRWKKEENIDGTHASAAVRSKPLKVDKDTSEESSGRQGMLKKMIGLVNDLAEDGGLKSADVRNLALASKALSEAQAKLEREELAQGDARGSSTAKAAKGKATDLLFLGHGKDLQPKCMSAYFAVLDVEEAREKGDGEKEQDAVERLLAACESEGFSREEVDIDEMIAEGSREFGRFMRQRDQALSRLRQVQGSLEAGQGHEFNGQGLA